ncbi:LEM-3-like GIY-YIG domain-containing protein [Salegentibacter maritimus]|uniref:LEM-3-like GIY-YIG domain-containing protein n=1 Tax=Salegentibacter maritimus TaxID=2794347 RepID=UPI0018E4CE09|nr:hypothetical protein [Salegentibacter maritimus]MBI6118348.1 hypothetical protein [Salegentibacter maritimus]
MSNNRFYVYGLIDPRDDQIFYIGKGTGKRYSSHLKKNRLDFNSGKIDRIKEIQENGLEVKIEILFPNLDENTAYELEKVLIYKLGREVFSEGILTNLVPGGNWKSGDPIFYDKNFNSNFDINRLGLFGGNKFLEIKKISNFDYLNTGGDQNIYRYNNDGSFNKQLTLNELFKEGVREVQLRLLNYLRLEKLPIIANGIYSKFLKNELYISEEIPFSRFDILDSNLHKEFDLKNRTENSFKLSSYQEDVLRIEISKENNLVDYQSYFNNGNKKAFNRTKNGKPFDKALEWFENGNLSIKEELLNGYSEYIRTTYYESGEKYIRIRRGNGKKEYDRWFKNGQKEVEFKNNSYFHYDENGKLTKTISPQ